MRRLPLAFALAAALSPLGVVHAEDLMQTYQQARQNDPQYAAAEANRAVAAENPVLARAALLPQIGGSVGVTRSDLGPGSSVQTGSWGVTLNQSLFDYGNYTALRGAKALDRAGGYDLVAAGHDLITRTSAAYFNVLVQLETLAAAEASEAALKKQFDLASKRLEVGLAPITDVHEARAQYDAARANTILTRNTLQDAYQALVQITGTRVGDLKGLPEDFRPALPSQQGGVDAWVANATGQNPSLQAQRADLEAAEANVGTARSGHLPTLGLSAGYGKALPSLYDPDFVGPNDATSRVGITLNVPIFSGFATQSQVRSALAKRDAAADAVEQTKRAVERNTRSAYQALVAGVSEVEARRLAVVSAKSAYDASQVGLEVGTRTVVDVLINQQNLFNAQQAYALAKYNFLQSRLLLGQAAGSLGADDVQDVNRLLTVDTPVGEANP